MAVVQFIYFSRVGKDYAIDHIGSLLGDLSEVYLPVFKSVVNDNNPEGYEHELYHSVCQIPHNLRKLAEEIESSEQFDALFGILNAGAEELGEYPNRITELHKVFGTVDESLPTKERLRDYSFLQITDKFMGDLLNKVRADNKALVLGDEQGYRLVEEIKLALEEGRFWDDRYFDRELEVEHGDVYLRLPEEESAQDEWVEFIH